MSAHSDFGRWTNAAGCLSVSAVEGFGLWGSVGNRGDEVAGGGKGIACMGGGSVVTELNCCGSSHHPGRFSYPLYAINFTAI
jgi:hypothetical protein